MSASLHGLSNRDRVELLIMGWVRTLIEDGLQVYNIPIECKLICKDFFGGLIDTKILKMDEENLLLNYVHQQTKRRDWSWKLIFRATEHQHSFAMDTFFKFCKTLCYDHCCEEDLYLRLDLSFQYLSVVFYHFIFKSLMEN